MTTHGKRHAKQDIMDAAWKLFTEQGYDETTIAQIIELSGNSRKTFTTIFVEKMNFSSASPIPTTVTMIAGFRPATGRFNAPISCSPSTILC